MRERGRGREKRRRDRERRGWRGVGAVDMKVAIGPLHNLLGLSVYYDTALKASAITMNHYSSPPSSPPPPPRSVLLKQWIFVLDLSVE